MSVEQTRKKSKTAIRAAAIVTGSIVLGAVRTAIAETAPAETQAAKPVTGYVIATHIFDPPVDALRGAFVRNWPLSGPKLCAALAAAGDPVGSWQQSPLDAGAFECSHETRSGSGNRTASLFIIVRGKPSGEIYNVRMKAIIPDTQDGRAIGGTFIDAIVTLLTRTRWLDFQQALDPIGQLRDVTLQAFGAKLAFFREFQDNRAFNLQVELKLQTAEQIRTATVFDRARWTLPAAQ
jgi:hypothetical protein